MSVGVAGNRVHCERREARGAGAADEAAARCAARRSSSDRDQGGMRRGRMRILFGAHERRTGEQLPGARVAGAGRAHSDSRRARASMANLHPLQQAFLHCGGAQCGICTPGMLMAATHLLANQSSPNHGGDSRRPRRQSLPMYGIQTHLRIGDLPPLRKAKHPTASELHAR